MSSEQYRWLADLLKSDGIDQASLENSEAQICKKCYQRYLKRKPEFTNPGETGCNISDELCDTDSENICDTTSRSQSEKSLPLLTIDDLFYGASDFADRENTL